MPSVMRTKRKSQWAVLAAVAGISIMSGCQPAPDDREVANDSGNAVVELPRLPVVEPPMDREALLLAVTHAASAAALGQDDRARQRGFDGKRFEVRVRFGCPSESAGTGSGRFAVRFDEEDRTLRLRASPDLGLEDPEIAALAGEAVEAVEGFWFERPWLLADGCPAVPNRPTAATPGEQKPAADGVEPVASGSAAKPRDRTREATVQPGSGQRVGIAHFFTRTDPRTGRRDHRAYEATKVLEKAEQPSAQGYNLVLSGRLSAEPLGRVISCSVLSADAPPQCVVSADFDRVWIERPGSRQIVAEWAT